MNRCKLFTTSILASIAALLASTRNRSWIHFNKSWSASFLACLALASCADLIGTHEVELPLTRLQQNLDRHFPINHRLLEIFDVQLSQPQLSIQPDSGRVSLTLATTISSPFMLESRSGNIDFSGNLYMDTAQNAIFLRNARVDRFFIDGLDEKRQRQLTLAASVITDELLKDTPLYRFHPEDLRYAGMQFAPTKITTTQNALAVTFEPVK